MHRFGLCLILALVGICTAGILAAPNQTRTTPTTGPSSLKNLIGGGSSTTAPSSAAAIKAADVVHPANKPQAKSPTTAPSSPLAVNKPVSKFPTPAELVERMKQMEEKQQRMPKIAYFSLDRPISEKPSDFTLFGGDTTTTLRQLIERLNQARQDKEIRAVLVTLGDPGLNLSQAMELRDAFNSLRREGKRTFVYADTYDTASYIAASGATDICMLGGGEIEIPGVGFETMFAKGLLDKLGVDADYVQIGEYKGADEEYTRSTASDELRGELNGLADALYNQIIDTISLSRNLTREDVKELVDESLIPGKVAKDRGLVDHLVDLDDLRELLANEIGNKVDLVNDYGHAPREQIDLSSPFALLSLLSKKPAVTTRNCVAVIYAEGVIVDGPSGGGLFSSGGNIGSEDMRYALRLAERDSNVQAVVIRIDSPGGSALASEVMWQAVRRVVKSKPVIISVGSMAASGGYYLASSGEYIFADPTAIVGSIGVVGGKFVMKGLYDKLGLNTESFLRGRNADLFSTSTEWTDGQRRMVINWMRQTYDQFTERVMTTRKGKIKDIDAIARGRIFTAKQARELGMVDEIGGVNAAIAYAAKRADLQPGEYDTCVFPPPRTLADYLGSSDDSPDSVMPFMPKLTISADSIIRVLPDSAQHMLDEQLQILQLLQKRPIMLVSPYVMTLR